MTKLSSTQPNCERCGDTGVYAVRSRDGAYVRPGPVPDDARGYAEADCWHCSMLASVKNEAATRLKRLAVEDIDRAAADAVTRGRYDR